MDKRERTYNTMDKRERTNTNLRNITHKRSSNTNPTKTLVAVSFVIV